MPSNRKLISASYYNHETMKRVQKLFFCSHPIFGKAENGHPTVEEALQAGKNLANKG